MLTIRTKLRPMLTRSLARIKANRRLEAQRRIGNRARRVGEVEVAVREALLDPKNQPGILENGVSMGMIPRIYNCKDSDGPIV